MDSNPILALSLNFKQLIICLYVVSFINFIQAFEFKYPKALSLKDGNIFIIHSKGIDICDSLMATNSRIITFKAEISESYLSKITLSKFQNEEFVIYINDTIYIFDEYGQKKAEGHINFNYAEYFSLSAHKIKINNNNNYYYFLLGYINTYNKYLNLYYYKIDSLNNAINIVDSLTIDPYALMDLDIPYNGLSCEFTLYNSNEYISCSFQNSYFFSLNSNKIRILILSFTNDELYIEDYKDFILDEIEYTRSTIKSIDEKSFFCCLKTTGEAYCYIYDLYDFYGVNKNNLTEIYSDDEISKKCVKKPYNIKTYYFSETDKYVFSCLTEENEIQTVFYSKNVTQSEEVWDVSKRVIKSFSECDEFYYSIIYSQSYKKYLIISDINCSNFQQIIPLYDEELKEEENSIEEEEEIIKEEKIENEEELIEEKNEIKKELEKNIIEEEKLDEEKIEILEELFSSETDEEIIIEEEKILEKENKKETQKIEESEKIEETIKTTELAKEKYICPLEKCSECDEESFKLNLCIKCNTEKGYYPLNLEEGLMVSYFFDCYNETTKMESFYFDNKTEEYKLCYSNCKTCDYGGDGNENNCTSCKNNQILKPDIPNSSNCVTKCEYFYYYQGEKYKCTETENCPDNYQLEIKGKRKCIDKCENDDQYIIRYDGECYKEPPEGTIYDEKNKIYRDINIDKCKLTEKILRLSLEGNITEYEIRKKAKLYAEEFDYTDEHVTIYKNDLYSITLYKDGNCTSELNLKIDEIDFGNCFTKIKETSDVGGNLIVVVISKIINNISTTLEKFVFKPNSGEKIDFIKICMNETVTVKKNIKEKIKNTENIESLEELTKQGIDIFNPENDFYTDLCFHFKSPINGKDIPVKDRLKLFYPNITLCDEGCFIKGVNLTTWKALCECTISNIVNSNIFGNNFLIQSSLGEINDLLTKTNIEVMKCYKDIVDKEMYKSNYGMFIILILMTMQIILVILYFFWCKNKIKKYILIITDKYILFLKSKSNINTNINNNLVISSLKNNNLIKYEPPKNNINLELNQGNKNKRNSRMKISKRKSENLTQLKMNDKINFTSKSTQKMSFNLSNQELNKKIQTIDIMEKANKEFEPIMNPVNNNININIEEYMKPDPDEMDYDEAIGEDKRTFCQYFCDQIKKEQIILSTFFKKEILQPIPIKMTLLILNIDLYLVINGLFFNEDYISDLLNSESDTVWSFINRILDRIINITIIGVVINYIIEFFFIKENKIKRILRVETNNIMSLKFEIVRIIKSIYIRYIIFFIVNGVIMIISLYYIFCLNNVYPSIKGEWIKSSIIIISIMQIFPIFLCFLDTCIRFISFKCKSERLFRLSSILL